MIADVEAPAAIPVAAITIAAAVTNRGVATAWRLYNRGGYGRGDFNRGNGRGGYGGYGRGYGNGYRQPAYYNGRSFYAPRRLYAARIPG
jgi:hypothetical protein